MNARDRLPVGVGATLMLVLLGGFQAVVHSSVDRGIARRAAVARSAEQTWRCNALRARETRSSCLLARDATVI